MPHLIWTPAALQAVRRCHDFLKVKNEDAATRAVRAIRQGMVTVAAQPQAGRPVDRMDTALREWLIPFGDSGYAVLYWLDGEDIVVLAIRHQREAGYS